MPKTAPYRKQFVQHFSALEVRADTEALPAGVCGRIQGVALVYETVDYYSTVFARGCMAKSISERVNNRKVNVFLDHDKRSRSHVGIISSMSDVGDSCVMTADILDTAEGRAALEYVKTVIAAKGETGLSIGFIPRKDEAVKDPITGASTGVWRYTEIELRETSITPVPAVPGAVLTGARNEEEEDGEEESPEVLLCAFKTLLGSIPPEQVAPVLQEHGYTRTLAPAPSAAPALPETAEPDSISAGSRVMPMDQRIVALRATYADVAA